MDSPEFANNIKLNPDSDDAFEDAISRLQYRSHYGIKATYIRATRLYIDMYITVKTAGDIDYTNREKNTIYNNINDGIQKFFAAYCVVGADIRLNALKAALNNSLSGFDIADIEVDIANSVIINNKNIVEVGNTQKAMPNKVLTNIEFVGGE